MSSRSHITLVLVCLAACSPSGETAGGERETSARGAATAGPCQLLTAADVQAVTGVTVQRIDRNPAIGAGGTCVNFAGADGQAYLGVNRLGSTGEFTAAVNAVPADVYPEKVSMPGLGEEALLFKGPGGLRYLVARQGTSGVVLFPLGTGVEMSAQQLRDLAAKALASAEGS